MQRERWLREEAQQDSHPYSSLLIASRLAASIHPDMWAGGKFSCAPPLPDTRFPETDTAMKIFVPEIYGGSAPGRNQQRRGEGK